MSKLSRKHLDKRLEQMRLLANAPRPPRGWLRAIREALDMTAAQLGRRLHVSQSRVSALERAEVDSSVTIASMQRAAEALDCIFVYALVPRQSLESSVQERARAVAAQRLARVDQTMRLENQAVSSMELTSECDRLARELAENPRRLWDTQ